MAGNEGGAVITLREIYDAALAAAAAADGARADVAHARVDIAALSGRVRQLERAHKESQTPAYIKRAAYILGTAAAAVVAGYTALNGG